MTLRTSRKILCVIFAFIMAIGSLLFAFSLSARCTMGSEAFLEKVIKSDSIKAECDKNFKAQLEAIALKSDIPVRVFDAVFNVDEAYGESVIKRVFANGDTRMFSQDKVNTFESLCVEYLEGNGISYSPEQVHRTAVAAAEAYADSYGMKNAQSITEFVISINNNYSRFASTGLILMAISLVLTALIFNDVNKKRRNIAFVLNSGGFAVILTGIIGLIFSMVFNANITPEFYSRAIKMVIAGAFGISLAIGIAITVISLLLTYKCFKIDDREARM